LCDHNCAITIVRSAALDFFVSLHLFHSAVGRLCLTTTALLTRERPSFDE
jgi:hypothetical protein